MKERPILFSGPMVRAILEGRKTQTRRVVRIDDTPISEAAWKAGRRQRGIPTNAENVRYLPGAYLKCDSPEGSVSVSSRVPCPYGFREDHLWVRETWRYYGGQEYEYQQDPRGVIFAADGAERGEGWRPSIFMPRWASRILLENTDVRAERLQDITEADARAEGACIQIREGDGRFSYRNGFANLWDQINAARGYGWDSNPWVWAIGFRVVEICGRPVETRELVGAGA